MINIDDQKILKELYTDLNKSARLAIFVHENPDCDALGSAFALQNFFHQKEIDARIVGINNLNKKTFKGIFDININKEADDDFIKNSFGIILDTANSPRILSQKQTLCKKLYVFDHHPKVENIGNKEFISSNYSSTCELIGWFIIVNNQNLLNKKNCNYLYAGLLTDTGRFMFKTTQITTFQLIVKFLEVGFDKNKIQDLIFLNSIDDFEKQQKIIKKIKFTTNGIGYYILPNWYCKWHQLKSPNSKIFLLNNLKELKIWFCLYEDKENNCWKGSIRSRQYDVSKIAKIFGGGGHILASGFKLNNKKEIKKLMFEIKKEINNKKTR